VETPANIFWSLALTVLLFFLIVKAIAFVWFF